MIWKNKAVQDLGEKYQISKIQLRQHQWKKEFELFDVHMKSLVGVPKAAG